MEEVVLPFLMSYRDHFHGGSLLFRHYIYWIDFCLGKHCHGHFAWKYLCWAEASLLAKKKTTWLEFLPYLHLIKQTKAVFPLNSFTNVRLSCSVVAVTRQFEKHTQVAFFPLFVSYRSLCCCLKDVPSYLDVMVARSSLICRDIAVFRRCHEAKPGGCRGVYVCTVIHVEISIFCLWLTRNVFHLLSVMPE